MREAEIFHLPRSYLRCYAGDRLALRGVPLQLGELQELVELRVYLVQRI